MIRSTSFLFTRVREHSIHVRNVRHRSSSAFLPTFRQQLQALPEFQQTQEAWADGNPIAALSSAERVTAITESIFGSNHGCTAIAIADLVKAKHMAGASKGVVSALERLDTVAAVREEAEAWRVVRLALAKARLITGDGVTGMEDVDSWDSEFMRESAEMWSVKAVRVGLLAARDGVSFDRSEACDTLLNEGVHVLHEESGSLEVAQFLHTVAACSVFSSASPGETFLKRVVEDSLRELVVAFPEMKTELDAIIDGDREGKDVDGAVTAVVAKLNGQDLSQLILSLNMSAVCSEDIVASRVSASKALKIADAVESSRGNGYDSRDETATKAAVMCTLAECLYEGGSVLEAEGLYATGIDLYRGIKHATVSCQRSAHAHLLDYAALMDKWENRQGQAEALRTEASKLDRKGVIRAEFLTCLQSCCLPE